MTRYLFLLLLPTLARADWPEANPGLPSFSHNSEPTATGAAEIEAGIATEKGEDGVAQWTLKYGVTGDFDVRVNLENTAWGPDVSLDSYGLLLKYTIKHTDDHALGIAVEPYFNLANPRDGFDAGAFVIGTYSFDPFSIDACVVGDVVKPASGDTQLTVSPIVAFNFPIGGPVGGFIEPGANFGDTTNPFVGAGVGYAASKFLIFDAAFYVADAPRTLILAGLTYSMFVPPK